MFCNASAKVNYTIWNNLEYNGVKLWGGKKPSYYAAAAAP